MNALMRNMKMRKYPFDVRSYRTLSQMSRYMKSIRRPTNLTAVFATGLTGWHGMRCVPPYYNSSTFLLWERAQPFPNTGWFIT